MSPAVRTLWPDVFKTLRRRSVLGTGIFLGALAIAVSLVLSGCTILRSREWPRNSGKIILTFDDGPTNHSTELLEVLRRRNVTATFCYIGENVEAHPEVVRKVLADGHVIANHTFDHRLVLLSGERFDAELLKTDQAIQNATGKTDFRSAFFRPPYGLLPPAVVQSREAKKREIAYLTFFDDDSGVDAARFEKTMKRLKRKLLENRGGAIVLHEMRYAPGSTSTGPSKAWLPRAVDELITWARENGMEFVTYANGPGRANPAKD